MANFIQGIIPERFVEVDSARLLLVLHRFSTEVEASLKTESYFPSHEVERHFSPEYYLQKLDFLLRYPAFFAYELIELHRLQVASDLSVDDIHGVIETILRNREPEMRTQPFRRFWYGAHERLRDVESWWHARGLVFIGIERRRDGKPTKHYFLTGLAADTADRMIAEVDHAAWYDERICLIKHFFGALTPSLIRNLQYSHPVYRDAQLARAIPNLSLTDVIAHFRHVTGKSVDVAREATDVA